MRPDLAVFQCDATVACTTNWRWSDWTDCPPLICGEEQAQKLRNVSCEQFNATGDSEWVLVSDSECVGVGPEPPAIQDCEAPAACSYEWHEEGDWTACPAECDHPAANQTQMVSCHKWDPNVNAYTGTYNDSFCSGTRPADARGCPDALLCQFDWDYVDFALCPNQCDEPSSIISRRVGCLKVEDSTNASSAMCEAVERGAGPKPSVNSTCEAMPKCTARWATDPFPNCTTACDTDSIVHDRVIQCELARPDGSGWSSNVNDYCLDVARGAGSAPLSNLTCNATANCTYTWVHGDFSCPETCGFSTVNRSTGCELASCTGRGACMFADTTLVNVTNTTTNTTSTVDETNRTCTINPGHYTNRHVCETDQGDWCEELVSSRNVTCVNDETGQTVSADTCLFANSTEPMPAMHMTCPATVDCAYRWSAPDHVCPTACGISELVVTRSVTCVTNDTGAAVSIDFCLQNSVQAGPVPSTNLTCNRTADCNYNWHAPEFDPCVAALCDVPALSVPRNVTCQKIEDLSFVNTTLCNQSMKPAELKTCPRSDNCTYSWRKPQWSDCPSVCGSESLNQTRDVWCVKDEDESLVEHSLCLSVSFPSECSVDVTCAGNSTCNGTCSGTGACLLLPNRTCEVDSDIFTDKRTCMNANGTWCDVARPDEMRTCPATPQCDYSWDVGTFSSCPTNCGVQLGDAEQFRLVQCIRRNDDVVIQNDVDARSLCVVEPPVSINSCNATANCTYYWNAHEFSQCLTVCGLDDPPRSERTYECRKVEDDSISGSNLCRQPWSNASTEPERYRDCNTTGMCTYRWDAPPFECPTVCGTDPTVLTRPVRCIKEEDNTTATDESLCNLQRDFGALAPPGPPGLIKKPHSTMCCNATNKCQYQWEADIFDPCPTGCGHRDQVITRSVWCESVDHNVDCTEPGGRCIAPQSTCLKYNAGPKPDTVSPCSATLACIDGFCAGNDNSSHNYVCPRGFSQKGGATRIACPVTPEIDCVGFWSDCGTVCTKQYTIFTPQSGGGFACVAENGEISTCPAGDDSCPPDVSCVGDWTSCRQDCTKQYIITTPQSGQGAVCPAVAGASGVCSAGEGNCPVNTDCVGDWTSCTASCTKQYIITTPQSGQGAVCPAVAGASGVCSAGEGNCPVNTDCVGLYSTCTASCTKQYIITTPQSGTGSACEEIAGASGVCSAGVGYCPRPGEVSGNSGGGSANVLVAQASVQGAVSAVEFLAAVQAQSDASSEGATVRVTSFEQQATASLTVAATAAELNTDAGKQQLKVGIARSFGVPVDAVQIDRVQPASTGRRRMQTGTGASVEYTVTSDSDISAAAASQDTSALIGFINEAPGAIALDSSSATSTAPEISSHFTYDVAPPAGASAADVEVASTALQDTDGLVTAINAGRPADTQVGSIETTVRALTAPTPPPAPANTDVVGTSVDDDIFEVNIWVFWITLVVVLLVIVLLVGLLWREKGSGDQYGTEHITETEPLAPQQVRVDIPDGTWAPAKSQYPPVQTINTNDYGPSDEQKYAAGGQYAAEAAVVAVEPPPLQQGDMARTHSDAARVMLRSQRGPPPSSNAGSEDGGPTRSLSPQRRAQAPPLQTLSSSVGPRAKRPLAVRKQPGPPLPATGSRPGARTPRRGPPAIPPEATASFDPAFNFDE